MTRLHSRNFILSLYAGFYILAGVNRGYFDTCPALRHSVPDGTQILAGLTGDNSIPARSDPTGDTGYAYNYAGNLLSELLINNAHT